MNNQTTKNAPINRDNKAASELNKAACSMVRERGLADFVLYPA